MKVFDGDKHACLLHGGASSRNETGLPNKSWLDRSVPPKSWRMNLNQDSHPVGSTTLGQIPFFRKTFCQHRCDSTQRNSTFFAFSLITEGATEKVLQFIMPLKSIYNKNPGFVEQKMYFWTIQIGSNDKKYINWHYFCHEFLWWPFQSCPL